jgi:hypothetical protein
MNEKDQETGATAPKQRASTDTARETAESLADEAREATKSARDAITEDISQRTEAGKAGVADEISGMSHALRKAADDLREGSPQERTFGHMASALADLSDSVRDKDIGELVDDVSGFARRNPVGFLAGAALLGFAGTRLAKASRRNPQDSVDLASYWNSDEHDEEMDRHITRRPAPTYGSDSLGAAGTAPRPQTGTTGTSTRPQTGTTANKGVTS